MADEQTSQSAEKAHVAHADAEERYALAAAVGDKAGMSAAWAEMAARPHEEFITRRPNDTCTCLDCKPVSPPGLPSE